MRSKNARRAAIGTTALPTPPAPMTRIRMRGPPVRIRLSLQSPPPRRAPSSRCAERASGTGGELPVDGAREAMAQPRAGATGQVPRPSGDIRPAIHDRDGQRLAVVPEGDQGPAL